MPMPGRRHLYRSLADYLDRSGDSQAGLARQLGIAQPMISRYATGESRPRSVQVALQIATYCDFPLEAFDHAALAYRRRKTA